MKDDQEKLIWPYYKYSILGFSTVFFVGILVYLFLGHMGIDDSMDMLSIALGYGAVGAGVSAYGLSLVSGAEISDLIKQQPTNNEEVML